MRFIDPEDLRRRMQEAASLPTSDPARVALMNDIVDAGEWASEEWLALVTADEMLRLSMHRVNVPSGLENSLLGLSNESAPGNGRLVFKFNRRVAAIAAVLVIGVGVVGATLAINASGPSSELRQLAMFALDHHCIHLPQQIETPGVAPTEFIKQVGNDIPFDARLPNRVIHASNARLIGGRACRLAARPVVFMRWEHAGKKISVYQFCAKHFDLPESVSGTIEIDEPWLAELNCKVIVWTEEHCAYAMVVASDTSPVFEL